MYRDILDLEPTHAGARTSLERRLGDEEHQLVAAAILEPIYERPKSGRGSSRCTRSSCVARRRSRIACRCFCASASCRRSKIGDGEKAFDAYARGVPRGSVDGDGARGARAAGGDQRVVWPSWWRCTSRRSSKLEARGHRSVAARASCSSRWPRRTTRSSRSRRRRPSTSVARRTIDPDDLTAIEALERLYTRNERWPELLEVYRKKVELSPEAVGARADLLPHGVPVGGDAAATSTRRSRRTRRCSAQDSANLKALKALDRLYLGRQAVARAGRQPERVSCSSPTTSRRRFSCWCAWRRCASSELGEVAAAVDTYRQVLELDRDNDEALARARAAGARCRSTSCRWRPSSSPSTRRATSGRSSSTPTRSWCATRWIRRARSSCSIRSASCTRWRRRGRPRRSAPTIARCARSRGSRRRSTRLERLARTLDRWKDLVQPVRLGRRAGGQVVGRRRAADAAFDAHGADRGDAARRQRRRGGGVPRACSRWRRSSSTRPTRSRRSTSAPTRTPSWSTSSWPRSTSSAPPTRRRSCCSRRRRSTRRCWRTPIARSTSTGRSCRSTRTIAPRSTRSSACTSASSAGSRSRTSTRRRPSWRRRPTRRSRCSSSSGRSTTASSRISTRAIETYQTILDLDPEDVTAIQALDRLYQQAGRWYDLLQILEREVELSSSTGETVSLKHRIGQLWEKELKDLGRAVEAYRDVLEIDGTHEPTLVALDGLVHGDQEPVLAAKVLEPIFEAGGEWERLIDVLDVMVRHTDDPILRVELLHRIADYYERRLESAPDAFKAYGQALKEDSRQRADARPPRAARRSDQGVGRAGGVVRAGARQAARGAAAGRHAACAWRASTRRSSGRPSAPSPPIAASSTPRRRTATPSSRSTGSISRPSAGASSPTSCGARSAWRRTTARSSRCSSGSGSSTSRTCATSTSAIEVYDEILKSPTAATRRRWPRSSCCSPRASSRSRSPASSSRSIGWPSSGRSWSRSTRSSSTS